MNKKDETNDKNTEKTEPTKAAERKDEFAKPTPPLKDRPSSPTSTEA